MKVKEQIENYLKENPETNYHTARYIVARKNKGFDYKPRPRKGLTKEFLDSQNVKIKFADNDFGYEVYQNGRKRIIFNHITGQYKATKRNKFHLYTCLMLNGKQKLVSLASLIMVLIIGKDIPDGYVVDHIDNDSFNNDISNLQLLTISENIKKDNHGHNQFTKI